MPIFAAESYNKNKFTLTNIYQIMLGIEEKDPVITGQYADALYEEYKSVYGEPAYQKNGKQV